MITSSLEDKMDKIDKDKVKKAPGTSSMFKK